MFITILTAAQNTPNPKDYTITTRLFTTKDGLSHNAIHSLYQDSRNLYWIPTRYGLNRFDGHQFKLYTKEKNGLHSNVLELVYDDTNPENATSRAGMIWLFSGGRNSDIWFLQDNALPFSIFNPYTEQVIDAATYLGKNLYKHLKNLTFYGKREDHLLFITKTGYIIKYYHQNKVEITKWEKPNNQFSYYKKLSNQRYWTMAIEPTNLNLRLFSKNHELLKKQAFCHINHACDTPQTCIGLFSSIVTNNKSDSIWFSSYEGSSKLHSFFCLLPTGKILRIPYHPLIPNLPKHQELHPIFYDAELNLFWLTDKIGKTYIVHPQKGLVFTLNFPLNYFYLKDRQQQFWANSPKGLYVIKFNKILFQKHLQGVEVRGIVTDAQKRIWAYPNHIEGLKSSEENDRFNYSAFLSSHSLTKDKAETIWSFCIYKSKLLLGEFKKENNGKAILTPVNLPESRIWSIYKEDATGLFWGGGEGGTFFNYDLKNQKTTVISNLNGFDAFKNATIYQIKPYGKQHFWLATSNGLYLMDKTKGIIARYWDEGSERYYLPTDAIHHIHIETVKNQSNQDIFWLGSRDGGLLKVMVKKSKNPKVPYQLKSLHQFTIADGLPSNSIHAIYESANQPDGYLWLSTENGITQFHKTTYFSTNYITEDGIVHLEGNRIAHYQDENGRLYFGTIGGITSFHPKDFLSQPNTQHRYIHIVGFDQYSQSKQQMENRIALFQDRKKIVLPSKEGRIELTLSKSFTLGVKNVFYTYQIKGLHKNPISLSEPKITISDIPFGKYTLVLNAFNSKGDLLDQRNVPLISKPPFYLQWWFVTIVLLLSSVLTYLLIQYRTNVLMNQKAILEEEVQRRTQQLKADKIIIEQQAQELKQLDETKSRFFANVSHELRTPIQLIQGPIQSVLKMNLLNNRGFTLLSKAERNAKNLLRLVNEILDLTKLEANKLTLQEEKVVFYTLLRRIISNFQSLADARAIRLTFLYHPKETLQIELDKNKFEKILNNLLSNAIKFTPKNGQISVDVSDASPYLSIKIKDTGRGIPKADLPYIFNRFYQSSPDNQDFGGLGIGLSLSMEFVKLMNGKMWAESSTASPNQGSIFYFQFLKKEVISMLSTEERLLINQQKEIKHSPSILPNHAQDNNPTILLVEDNYDLHEYLQFLLAPHYNIIIAENGKEGLEILNNSKTQKLKNPIAFILSDVMMPIMDGFEFLEKVKANEKWRHIPFIMLTARAELNDKLKALRIGVDDYLLKPFKEEELLVRIENLLTNAEERSAFLQLQTTSNTKEKVEEALPSLSKAENQWLEKVEKLVLEHLTDNRFSVDFLAELLAINRKTLYQKVKALTGLTPNQYIRTIRLQHAKEQLEKGKYTSVKAAANNVGFSRPDYFSKLFVKAYGKTPIEYL